MNDEVEKEITSFVLRLKNQIIFEHYVKVREKCRDSLFKQPCLDCILWLKESPFGLTGDCMKRNITQMSEDQLKAFIEKVERGE